MPVASEQTDLTEAVVENTAPASAQQPKQRSEDEQTSPASVPYIQKRAEARAAANSLIPKSSENSIAPPSVRAEAGVNGKVDDAAKHSEIIESAVVEEEEA